MGGTLKSIIHSYIGIRFDEYDESLKEVEDYFSKQSKEILPYTEEELSLMKQEKRDEIMQWYSEDYLNYTERFPKTLRNSYFIGYYSLYEHLLYDICVQVKKDKDISTEISSVDGKGIFRFRKYLEDVCKIKLSDTSEWNEINHINAIRNSLVHNLGKLSQVKKHKQYFEKYKAILQLDNHNRVEIKNGYLEIVSSLFKRSLYKVLETSLT